MKLSCTRVIFQIVLHAVLAGHVLAYYFLDWKKVGALDFQAFFHYFLGKGLLTAGAILAIVVYGSALVFGRLFCSWGCHFGATQDLAAWVMRRIGWKPPLVRTRFLHGTPYLVLLAVFVLPLLETWSATQWGPFKRDLAAVAPWDTLPGWLGSIAMFIGCGAMTLLFLGTRGFCRFVCPYGALFRITDLAAPFRVRKVAACSSGCASSGVHPCTAACPTAIDVHLETNSSGRVTSVDCVRCNLCIEACPSKALAHVTAGAARARIASSAVAPPEPGTTFRAISLPLRAPAAQADAGETPAPQAAAVMLGRYDLPLWGEAVVLGVAVAAYLAADIVYGGHFLAAALALGEGFLTFHTLCAISGSERATLLGWPLRRGRSWTFAGITLVGVFALSLVPFFEAGASKWLRREGLRLDPDSVAAGELEPALVGAALISPARAELEQAADRYRRALEYVPSDVSTRKLLLSAYVRLADPRAVAEAEELHRRIGDADSFATLEWVRRRLAGAGTPR